MKSVVKVLLKTSDINADEEYMYMLPRPRDAYFS